jgi:hypothetical protein
MKQMHRGTVQGRTLVFAESLPFPEGTEVTVQIEPVTRPASATGGEQGFASLPFFGMWADRDEMKDGAAWVRRERETWHQRAPQ